MRDPIFFQMVQSALSFPKCSSQLGLSELAAVTFLDFKYSTRTLTVSLHIIETEISTSRKEGKLDEETWRKKRKNGESLETFPSNCQANFA